MLTDQQYVQPSPGSPQSSLLFSPTTTATGLDTKKGTRSHEVEWSLLMREDAKSRKKLANKPSSHFKDSQFYCWAQHVAHAMPLITPTIQL